MERIHDKKKRKTSEKQLKRSLIEYIAQMAPFMGTNRKSVKRNFNRKVAAMFGNEEMGEVGFAAIVDRRTERSGYRREAPDWDNNLQLMAQWTLVRGGRVSQAWRELHTGKADKNKRFTEGFRNYYPFNPRESKSQVPVAVRHAVKVIIEATRARRLGPKAARLAQPSIHRDWSDTCAGDYYTADDITINHYWWDEDEFGEYEYQGMRFNVVRGQWLITCDERTGFPLGFLLMPSWQYNSHVICTLNTKFFSDERIGLPFRGMKYEKGIWKARNIASQFSWAEIDQAFAQWGLSLAAAQKRREPIEGTSHNGPRSKVIEGQIGILQKLSDHLPGYVGNDERKIRYEEVQKFLKALKRVGQPLKADVDPREMLLSKEQMADALVKTMQAYADEPQNGERLNGISPAEGWVTTLPLQ